MSSFVNLEKRPLKKGQKYRKVPKFAKIRTFLNKNSKKSPKFLSRMAKKCKKVPKIRTLLYYTEKSHFFSEEGQKDTSVFSFYNSMILLQKKLGLLRIFDFLGKKCKKLTNPQKSYIFINCQLFCKKNLTNDLGVVI